ncbi:efflux transporter outer membrane subunit [Uliginosibacterium sp. 31-16]|uniref:efflux transporter outer membrane subunit n=1 Tax=Uliginosibacterium sp. 31-16 TaxID=3068315 RepID=UPI00273F34A8|nr:efflux transporter outer membrane subunit [Uliginosibacterium sp. 31-16]MDP5238863.1 efflux transporter outer membrane subunit [Uliginosibacterium sp. 31-16]
MPSLPNSPAAARVSRPLALLALASLMGLAACAQIPQTDPFSALKPSSDWSAEQSLNGPSQAWPQERWWNGYADAQLDRLIGDALAGAPSLRVAAARLQRADAGVQTRQATNGPQLTANASASEAKQSYNYLTPKSMSPQGWNDYGRISLDFSWELDFWGKNRSALAAATSEREAAAADAAQAALLLSSSIASGYAELARLHAARDTAAAALEVRSKTAQLFQERHTNGLETLGSVRGAEARQAAAEGDLLAADESIALQRNYLAALLGAGPDRGLAIVRPTIRLDNAPGLPDQLALELLGRRPDVIAARLRAEAAAKRIDSAKAEFYPNVNLSAFIGVQSLGLDKLFKSGSDIGSVGPAISLPIFDSGRLQAQYRSRRADYEEAVANYDSTVTQALREVADAAVSQRALAPRLERGEAAFGAAKQAWQIARNRYDGGLSNYLDVLTAEDAMLTNLRGLTDLQSRAFSLDVALVRALGGGYQHN